MTMIDLEREFGKDYKERFREGLIKDFASDEVTRSLFDGVCEEIKCCSLSDEELVDKLKILPSNIAFVIVRSLENEREGELISMLNKVYLTEFNNSISKDSKIPFEDRIKFKKAETGDRFLLERIITRHEIDCVVRYVSRLNKEEIYLNLYAGKPYHGENETIKKLLCFREKIQHTTTKKKIDSMIDKIKQPLLRNLLEDLKKQNQNIEV